MSSIFLTVWQHRLTDSLAQTSILVSALIRIASLEKFTQTACEKALVFAYLSGIYLSTAKNARVTVLSALTARGSAECGKEARSQWTNAVLLL